MRIAILLLFISGMAYGQSPILVSSNNQRTYTGIQPMPSPIMGGNGRYMYWLVCNNYTVAVPTVQYVIVTDAGNNDVKVDSIPLTANKNFSSIHYRSVDQTVHVAGEESWINIIDANSASGTFNDVIVDATYLWGSCAPSIMNYLPYPLDFFTTGGTSKIVYGQPNNLPLTLMNVGNAPGDIGLRFGGHSNFPNSVYYHSSQVLYSNRNLFQLINTPSDLFPNTDYQVIAYQGGGDFNDLNGAFTYSVRFADFYTTCTTNSVYLFALNTAVSDIAQTPWPTMGTTERVMHEYAPNARKIFYANQISNNIIGVMSLDSVNHLLVDGGDIDRTAYKATNESGCAMLIYNPYNGFIYAMANNNINLTGVDKVHVYDPTQSTASMYVRTITIGEFKSQHRASVQSMNTATMNRTRLFEHPNVHLHP